MKVKTTVVAIILFLSVFSMFVSCRKQKSEWKGTIEKEGGVTIVKNPKEPIFGEIILDLEEELNIGNVDDENYVFYRVLDLEVDNKGNIYALDAGNHRIQKFDKDGNYLQTIGRQGQGPGEFERPSRIFLDGQNNIYVADGRGRRGKSNLIKVFTNKGDFIRIIHLESPVFDFCINSEGNIFANVVQGEEGETVNLVVIMSAEGKIIKNIAEFVDVKEVTKKSGEMRASFRVHHMYTPRLSISRIDEQNFFYAYSSEYKISVVDNNGNLQSEILKREESHLIRQKEKKFIMEKIEESISRSGTKWPEGVLEEACSFPPNRPFFRGIIVDDLQRLYIWKVKSVLDKSEYREFDLFNKAGYFLYGVKISVLPGVIRKGLLYDIKEDEETGDIFIRRFKIKKWDEIKEGI